MSGVVAAVWNYYAGKALQGGNSATQNTTSSPVDRQAAGVAPPPPPAAPPGDVQGWVEGPKPNQRCVR